MNLIKLQDPELWAAIAGEIERQQDGLEMIASENYTSGATMQALGSVLTNKYAEGYPGHRYYGGCQFVDIAEDLARDRAKQLFGAEHANVQPHSGSQANMAVYLTAIEPGDTVLSLDLAHGGHLTHGMKLNVSGKLYSFVHYGVDRTTHRFDFSEIAKLARQHKPKMIIAGRDCQRDRCNTLCGYGTLCWFGSSRSAQQSRTRCRFCDHDYTQNTPWTTRGTHTLP